MSNLAVTLSDQGKLDEAGAGQQEVLKKRQPAHPWRRASKQDHMYDNNEYDEKWVDDRNYGEDFYRGERIQEYSMDENDLAVMFAMEKNKVDATDMVDLECRDDAEGENADPWWGRHEVFENENADHSYNT
ncbi:hypothetical protein VE00_10168 [Pseudogymnoascus sp. WSF 3629]|nr:hypothetical protein VE00_10168 [Pseudogymnoascus sp. WSF 3629]